jgi:radical SAM superfamily enzyme YgiQ (UPF0313 family)
MKVTLIEPAMIKTKTYGEKPSWVLPPLTLSTLAGMTPPDIEVEAVDDRIETIDYEASRDLVGISVKTFTAKRAYQIAAEFRKRGVPVVLGGHHPTLLPEESRRHADALVLGEAEGIWEALLRDAARRRLKPSYAAAAPPPLANLRVDHSVLAKKRYLPVTMLETTRGCPFACNFCSVTAFFGRGFRHRPPEEVVDAIAQVKSHAYFFVDDNIVADRAAAKALFRALIPLRIRWLSQASLTMTRDLELMRLMRDSGCAGVLVGLESINQTNLKQINKGWNTVGIGYDEALEIARDHGIAIVGSFILGMDEDSKETLAELLEFTIRKRFFAVLFNLLTPYPGTVLYDRFVQEGRLEKPIWWLDEGHTYGMPVFEPRRISAAELARTRMSMYREFYGPISVARRLWDPQANLRDLWHAFTFLGMNLPAHKEEALRFGQSLGAH